MMSIEETEDPFRPAHVSVGSCSAYDDCIDVELDQVMIEGKFTVGGFKDELDKNSFLSCRKEAALSH